MFDQLDQAPADPILGLTEAFKSDPNPQKVNLGVGIYKDANGLTPVLDSVKRAETIELAEQQTKSYLGIAGLEGLGESLQPLLFGDGNEIIAAQRALTAQTPGGTGALRVAADFIHNHLPGAKVWVSDPTWANHKNIFNAAGVEVCTYPYYDEKRRALAFGNMIENLARVPAGDVVLLHACCHNPTGMDPTHEQWEQIAALVAHRRFLPFFDFAYQGFGEGIDADATGVRAVAATGVEMLVASSFSKNFGLYNERVGALTVVAGNADAAQKALGHIKRCIRANYSNPPAHGINVVKRILDDAELRALWIDEVAAMRDRINTMRQQFVATLARKGVSQDFSFITRQHGMFSYSGLNPAQVDALRNEHSIYIVGSGRINVAGMTGANVERLCEAIAAVLAQ